MLNNTTSSLAQPLSKKKAFTHQDTLRGSIGPERAWWDVEKYDLQVTPDYIKKSIKGINEMSFALKSSGKDQRMQIDLQEPMKIDSLFFSGKKITDYKRDGNVYSVGFDPSSFSNATTTPGEKLKLYKLKIFFSGNPRVAITPPWDGGWIFTKDELGRPWMTVACQGLGASVWYPCKDHQSDEPDNGATLTMTVPDSLVAVGNGRLTNKKNNNDGTTSWTWTVKSPINNYTIIPYIGKYVNFTDTLHGEKARPDGQVGPGILDCSYWVLDYNLEKAKKQFGRDVKRMLRAFEYWFGPYPFYEDSYKLVESSHLGMEHQSATAYGNHYKDGYLGSDLSGTGWGLKWDYIIVHESGHEWFANNITTNDIADMWVHEGFTMYSEALFIEYWYGKKAADEYVQGIRNHIDNDKPIIGYYGVNQEGSSDMYNKGANMLHTIRQVINNDSLFRSILRGLNKDYYHKTVDSKEVEAYISKKSGIDFSKVFDQYLRTIKIPVLEYKITEQKGEPGWYHLEYRWLNCVEGFKMPVKISVNGNETWINPTTNSDMMVIHITSKEKSVTDILVDKNFYIATKKTE